MKKKLVVSDFAQCDDGSFIGVASFRSQDEIRSAGVADPAHKTSPLRAKNSSWPIPSALFWLHLSHAHGFVANVILLAAKVECNCYRSQSNHASAAMGGQAAFAVSSAVNCSIVAWCRVPGMRNCTAV